LKNKTSTAGTTSGNTADKEALYRHLQNKPKKEISGSSLLTTNFQHFITSKKESPIYIKMPLAPHVKEKKRTQDIYLIALPP